MHARVWVLRTNLKPIEYEWDWEWTFENLIFVSVDNTIIKLMSRAVSESKNNRAQGPRINVI